MRILIADDEPLARQRLRRLVDAAGAGEVVAEAATGRETLAGVSRWNPDLVLLDIRMPEGDGLSVAMALAAETPPPAVVFVTALADRALGALQAGAAAYLVKPVNRERLAAAIARACRPSRAQLLNLARVQSRRYLAARVGRELRMIPLLEVNYFRACDKTTLVHYAGGEVAINESLTALENEFGARFMRIRRDLLVRCSALRRLLSGPAGAWVELDDGSRLPVARRLKRRVAAYIERGNDRCE